MVTSQKTIKKRKDSVKMLSGLKKKKENVNLKCDRLSKKKREHGDFVNVETAKVSDEMGKLKSIKLIKKNLKTGVQGSIGLGKKSIHSGSGRYRINKFKNIQPTEVEPHVDSDKEEDKMNGVKVTNYTVKAKRSTNSKVQNNKIATDTTDTTKIVKAQKRKRVGSISDCLNLNDLSKEHILQCISAIFHLTEKQLESKNALFDGESQPVFMQVTCIRIPKTPRRCMRVLLPYSIVSSNDEVALFVGDLVRGRRKDYEPTVEYYENLLRKQGCTKIKSIIPMNQVKTEYDQFELKRKLVGSYDWFLVDGKIAGHLSHLLGKEFYKKRKLPTSVRMQTKDLNHEIDHALRKTLMQIHSCGDTHIIQIGHSSMEKEKIFDNILAACTYLSKNYPGGWANIRSIKIKTSTSLALSIYTTLKSKNKVKVSVVKPKRPKAYRDVTGDLSTVSSIDTVTVTPEGDITVVKAKTTDKIKYDK